MPTIACHTLGCKVNQYDTEAMLESFEAAGWTSVPLEADADLYLINTCTVTHTGDRKSLKLIRRIRREHPESLIIAAGCLTQREPGNVLDAGANLAIGIQNRAQVVQLAARAKEEGRLDAVKPLKGASFESLFVSRHEGKTRATMKIQEGCDRYCAYCIIPSVRGPVRSMPLEEVRKEAKRLADSGYREIVVTGIHLSSYGRGTEYSLIDAIEAVHDTPGVMRVRLGSLEPTIVTEEFAERLGKMNGLCRQFHLSLQSGSEGVLRRMNRRYTPDEYYESVCILRRSMPGCAVTTDVIAGFAGETEEEFRETEAFLEKVAFARIHVFPYSRRKGTKADLMPGQVPEELKRERTAKLIELGNRMEAQYVKDLVGTEQQVLFEVPEGDGRASGYTGTFVRVVAGAAPGEIRCVKITGCDGTTALGE